MNEVIKCREVFSLGIAEGIPTDIQYMPPGRHKITPTVNGKPQTIEVSVDEKTVDALNASLKTLEQDGMNKCYIDFNHNDAEASGYIKGFSWGGDDSKTGGVRAQVEWTVQGSDALKGKAYRRFSPQFFAPGGKVAGCPINAGGLVNRPAFTAITPIVAGQGDLTTTPKIMDEEMKKKMEEKDKEIEALKAKIAALESKDKAQCKAVATATVEAAIAAGKLQPKNEAIKAKWIATLEADPTAGELLAALQERHYEGRVIQGKADDNKPSGNSGDRTTIMAKLNATVDGIMRARGCGWKQAWELSEVENPELHKSE